MTGDFLSGDYQDLPKRGILEATCRKYGYTVGSDKYGKTVQIADYRDPQTRALVAQKLRGANKTFSVIGEGKQMPLWGQHLWPEKGLRVVITEGEIDALSVAQAFDLRWPVVSLPNGAQSAAKALQRALPWLEGYEQVVLLFDMDAPGREAAQECAPLLSPGRCRIAELPLKDANEMLLAGRVRELVSAIYDGKVWRPDGIVALADIETRVLEDPVVGRPWFDERMTELTYGRVPGELIGIGGATGGGKTSFFLQQILHDVTELNIPTGVLMLEQDVGETGRRLAGLLAGRHFHLPDGQWTRQELLAAWERVKGSRLHLYDSFGISDWEQLRGRIRYLVKSMGCEHIYLDHLTALAAAEEDENIALKRIMAEAAGDAKEMGHVLHFISHLATPEGKPHEEGGRVMTRHFRGSRAIGYWSHNLLGLERNQQADDPIERQTTTCRFLKWRRRGSIVGSTVDFRYDEGTGRIVAAADKAPMFKDETAHAHSDF